MIKLTEQEYNELTKNCGYGVCHFMGGCGSYDNIIHIVGNEIVIAETDEDMEWIEAYQQIEGIACRSKYDFN